jgi:hypothetical protein
MTRRGGWPDRAQIMLNMPDRPLSPDFNGTSSSVLARRAAVQARLGWPG